MNGTNASAQARPSPRRRRQRLCRRRARHVSRMPRRHRETAVDRRPLRKEKKERQARRTLRPLRPRGYMGPQEQQCSTTAVVLLRGPWCAAAGFSHVALASPSPPPPLPLPPPPHQVRHERTHRTGGCRHAGRLSLALCGLGVICLPSSSLHPPPPLSISNRNTNSDLVSHVVRPAAPAPHGGAPVRPGTPRAQCLQRGWCSAARRWHAGATPRHGA